MFSLHKILCFFLCTFCCDVCNISATSCSVLPQKYIMIIIECSSSGRLARHLYSSEYSACLIIHFSTESSSVRNSLIFSSSPLMFPFNAENWISCWFCQYHLTHFIRTRIMQRERYDHSRAFFELPEAAHRWRCRFFCWPSNSYNISRS